MVEYCCGLNLTVQHEGRWVVVRPVYCWSRLALIAAVSSNAEVLFVAKPMPLAVCAWVVASTVQPHGTSTRVRATRCRQVFQTTPNRLRGSSNTPEVMRANRGVESSKARHKRRTNQERQLQTLPLSVTIRKR